MENLNAEQIIKALECCVKVGGYRDAQICNDCPLSEKRCAILLPENALALITSQEQRIKELTEKNEMLRAEKEAGNKELFHKWKKLADETADRYENLYQTAKKSLIADTVRKMQERVKAKILEINGNLCGLLPFIDQIAKEMLEGNQ